MDRALAARLVEVDSKVTERKKVCVCVRRNEKTEGDVKDLRTLPIMHNGGGLMLLALSSKALNMHRGPQ